VVLMVTAVVVSSLATWAAAVQIHSPAEVAARTAPPTPSPILVPVVARVLSTRVVTRGTAHFGSPRALKVTPSSLKDGARIVTSLPARGAKLTPGDVLATVSGRPVFLLAGRMPAFRDLGPGMSGKDVAQLERSLRRLRLAPGAVDGSYDAATGDAVARLYRGHGFEPVVATAKTLAGTRPAEAGLVRGAFAEPGVQLPSDEVVFVGSGPLRVTELPTPVGSRPEGALTTVTGSDVVIDGQLRVEQAGRVRAGAKVLVDEPTLGIDATGRVTWVAGRPGTDGADGFHVSFRVTVEDPPPTLVGASVRLTVPIRSTRTAQLTVPVTAVSLGPDGGSRVERSENGVSRFVAVRTGLSADGFVGITAARGSLAAGDRVVVGFQARPRAGG
jgi:hypothetical protein